MKRLRYTAPKNRRPKRRKIRWPIGTFRFVRIVGEAGWAAAEFRDEFDYPRVEKHYHEYDQFGRCINPRVSHSSVGQRFDLQSLKDVLIRTKDRARRREYLRGLRALIHHLAFLIRTPNNKCVCLPKEDKK